MIDENVLGAYLSGCRDIAELLITRVAGCGNSAPQGKSQRSDDRQIDGRKGTQRYVLDVLRTAADSLLISDIVAALAERGIDRTRDQVRAVLRRTVENGWVLQKGSGYLVAPFVPDHVWTQDDP